MNPKGTFLHLLSNALIASVTNAFIWFALIFWVYLETHSVLATSLIAGIFAVLNTVSALFFGTIVDHTKKKTVMILSSCASLFMYSVGSIVYFLTDVSAFENHASPVLWALIIILMIGSMIGNLRMIALTTSVSLLFSDGERDKSNGMIGAMNGVSFGVTSVLSGLVIGFFGMHAVLIISLVATTLVIAHMFMISLPEDLPVSTHETKSKMDIRGTIAAVAAIPGLFALIFFTTFNNFLGGVFMALMDAYGLSLVSVQAWGFIFGSLSLAFIAGGAVIAKYGLGVNPVRTMFIINIINWTVCIFFTIQSSIILLLIGLCIWMFMIPFVEGSEQTIIQKLVPYERQGRVFGFAQSVESAASPITTFFIGPIAQFVFIPLMTTGMGAQLIGSWYGVGNERGIALLFTIAGIVGLIMTILARLSRSYKLLSSSYSQK